MSKCVYRNFYYVKESVVDFFKINKKALFLSILSVLVGVALGLFVGIKNLESYTSVNMTDGIVISFFTNKRWLLLFVKMSLKYLFFVFLVMLLCNFDFLSYLCLPLFGYLAFNSIINAILFCHLFGIMGFLFGIACYLLCMLLLIFLLIMVFLMCKCSSRSCGQSNKFSFFPINSILIVYGFMLILILIYSILCFVFSKFISFII